MTQEISPLFIFLISKLSSLILLLQPWLFFFLLACITNTSLMVQVISARKNSLVAGQVDLSLTQLSEGLDSTPHRVVASQLLLLSHHLFYLDWVVDFLQQTKLKELITRDNITLGPIGLLVFFSFSFSMQIIISSNLVDFLHSLNKSATDEFIYHCILELTKLSLKS